GRRRGCAKPIKRRSVPARTIAGMSATDDAFARFLEVLAASLDDHQAAGDALASRVHLSRFHFDRLVSAAAGEPPATLRRRVLLEGGGPPLPRTAPAGLAAL